MAGTSSKNPFGVFSSQCYDGADIRTDHIYIHLNFSSLTESHANFSYANRAIENQSIRSDGVAVGMVRVRLSSIY